MRWENLDDPQDFLELFGSRPSEVRNLFLRARELVKFHRHLQTRLYRETTSLYVTKLMRHALCPSISPNAALESDKARM